MKIQWVKVIFLLGVLSVIGLAEEVPSTQNSVQIVVTGTKSERTLKDVPVRTELITEERIKEKGAVNLYEVLNNEPGVRVEMQCSNCNFTTIRMQGLENYAQILVDGKPLFGGVNAVYGLEQVQAAAIEQIEIVKGPGSALYGSDAIAGVINIKMKEPSLKPKTIIDINADEHGSTNYGFYTSQRRGNIAWSLNGQKSLVNAIDENDDKYTDQVERDNVNLNGKLYIYDVLGKNSQLHISGEGINEFRRGGHLDYWEEPFDVDAEHIKTKRNVVGIGLKKEFDSVDQISVDYSVAYHDRYATNGAVWADVTDNPRELPTLNMNDFPEPFLSNETIQLIDITYARPMSQTNTVIVGIQHRQDDLAESISGTEADKNSTDTGIFVQNELQLSDKLELVAGVRYDMHKSKDSAVDSNYEENAFNPRVALKFAANDNLIFRSSIGTSFRVPHSFSEDAHLCASSPRIYKSADLQPEKAQGISLGMDYQTDTYGLDINVFRTNIQDKIKLDDGAPPSGYTHEWLNSGDAYTQGIEMGVNKNFTREFSVRADYDFTEARYAEAVDGNKHVRRSPQNTGGLALVYDSTVSGWKALFETRYIGEMYIDHETTGTVEKTEAYTLSNMRLAKTFENKQTEIITTWYVGVKNLFDYVQEDRDLDDAAYIWAPLVGRKIYAGVTMEF